MQRSVRIAAGIKMPCARAMVRVQAMTAVGQDRLWGTKGGGVRV